MVRSTNALIALCFLAQVLAAQGAPNLQGVWEVIQIAAAGPNAATNNKPLPNLYIFTQRHYSLISEDGDSPRTAPNNTPDSPREELLDMLRFSAQGGTYEVSGNEITFRRVVALAVPNMAPGNFRKDTFRLQGDTLWLTITANQDGPVANPATLKLRRVE